MVQPVRSRSWFFLSSLDFAFQSGGSLYKLLSSVTASAGLILYTDEIVVGNPLAHKPRKLWAVYCACQPFGVHLQDDNSWVTLAIVKSSVVQKLGGQLSQLMKDILLSIFFSGACEPLHFGVQLSNPAPLTGKRKMQFHLAYIIQDGGAHKYFWNIKGDGGSRYCIKCRNVLLGGMKTVWTQSQHTPKCLTCPSQPKMRFLILGTDLRKGKGNAMPQPSGSGNKPLAFAGVNTAFWDAKSWGQHWTLKSIMCMIGSMAFWAMACYAWPLLMFWVKQSCGKLLRYILAQ